MAALVKIGKWAFAISIIALLIGSTAAFFLWALDTVTLLRFSHPWLIYFLPIAGLGMGFYYHTRGKRAASGNQLIFDKVADPHAHISHRLAPSIFIATLITHLFGGSAGREGTAVQMGAGIAASCSHFITDSAESSRLLILCGVAAGFGAVFGTPFAGAVFALEFTRKRIISLKLIPFIITALAAHYICMAWGTEHTVYPEIQFTKSPSTYLSILWKIFLFALLIALASRLFIWLSNTVTFRLSAAFPSLAYRAAIGGAIVVLLYLISGTGAYLGLGVLAENKDSLALPRFFSSGTHAPATAWLWKMAFTIATLSAGFKGGEVTPLFFIGAALGNSLAWILGAPIDLFAGIGMIAFFGAATKTPYASVIMGAELLGWNLFAPLALCTFTAWKFSGKLSVYDSPPYLEPVPRGVCF